MKKTAYALTVLLPALLTACAVPAAPAGSRERAAWAQPVDEAANLYRVDGKLYRSEQLAAEDAARLQALGVRSIVNLRFFDRDDDQAAFRGQSFDLINKPLLTWHITPQQIADILDEIERRQADGAVLVHCYHGADRTGLIVGMYRIIRQGWSIEAAKAEMQQGPYGYHSIWQNIAKLFTEERVAQVRARLAQLRDQRR